MPVPQIPARGWNGKIHWSERPAIRLHFSLLFASLPTVVFPCFLPAFQASRRARLDRTTVTPHRRLPLAQTEQPHSFPHLHPGLSIILPPQKMLAPPRQPGKTLAAFCAYEPDHKIHSNLNAHFFGTGVGF
jgi:hypothetical protein